MARLPAVKRSSARIDTSGSENCIGLKVQKTYWFIQLPLQPCTASKHSQNTLFHDKVNWQQGQKHDKSWLRKTWRKPFDLAYYVALSASQYLVLMWCSHSSKAHDTERSLNFDKYMKILFTLLNDCFLFSQAVFFFKSQTQCHPT